MNTEVIENQMVNGKQEQPSVPERNLLNAREHAALVAAFYTECSKRGIPLDDAKELTEEWMRIFWGR